MTEAELKKIIRTKTIRAFAVFFSAMFLFLVFWFWLLSAPKEDGALRPLRKMLYVNEKINALFFSGGHKAKEYPKSAAEKEVRVNGDAGMSEDFEFNNWKLNVHRHFENTSSDSVFTLSLDDIKSLPKQDIVFDFKCIEGWNQITHWGGARFIDFMMKYKLGTHSGKAPDPLHPEDLYKYVALLTPDSAYYVGIDIKSIMHTQTLLCYEMNDLPLPINQGAPLRLIITVKYGVKSLKRIGTIYFSDKRPKDYWFERGYDYDAAL